jgi:hypothetical protein
MHAQDGTWSKMMPKSFSGTVRKYGQETVSFFHRLDNFRSLCRIVGVRKKKKAYVGSKGIASTPFQNLSQGLVQVLVSG